MDKYRKNMLIELNGVPCRIIDVQADEFLDEEYYGLIHYLRNNIEHYTALDEQNRLEFVRQYFSSHII